MNKKELYLLMTKIRYYQNCGDFHPLTCGINFSHNKLVPIIIKDKVILKCPDCKYTQDYIPDFISSIQLNN